MDTSNLPINSIKRSYDIVNEIRDREQAGVTKLAESLDLPKSTVHNHLRSLEQLGYLVQNNKKYQLSTKYLHLGREARNSRKVFLYGRKKVENLQQQTNAYCQLVTEENGMGAILLATGWHYDDLPPTARHVYPTHAHLHTNAPGKTILAHLPKERVAEIINRHGLPQRTKRTVTDEDELHEQLTSIREQGYAVDRSEMIDGVGGIGVPIATDDAVYGAIAAYGPTSEIQPEIESGELPPLVQESAETIQEDIVFGTRR
jgi:DNA-binding IclR family transcriptional regulator